MPPTTFTKAELERVLDAAREARTPLSELHIIKTAQGTTLRAVFQDLSSAATSVQIVGAPTLPEPWS